MHDPEGLHVVGITGVEPEDVDPALVAAVQAHGEALKRVLPAKMVYAVRKGRLTRVAKTVDAKTKG
jgi:hypothetical protein